VPVLRDLARAAAELDLSTAQTYAIPMTNRFRGITVREGVLVAGPAGWGEFCPFPEYDDQVATGWLAAAVESAVLGWPAPVRDRIPVNVTVPVLPPRQARELVAGSGCSTAKVKVADHAGSPAEDCARLEAVRDALGPAGQIRVDANGGWDVDTAAARIPQLDRAAGGLQYVEQPCPSLDELATVRRRVQVPIAADESIRRAEDPLAVAVARAADIAVIKCTPLGGVARSLQVAAAAGLPCVISSALETSVGLAAQLALAGALPELEYACGLGTVPLLRADLVPAAASLVPSGGFLPVPLASPQPEPELLQRYAISDPGRAAWWIDRLQRVHRLLRSLA
jgi:O-succinylbenzoate synthase